MDRLEISVVIPMYNSEKTIISVLDAIHFQSSFKHIYEVIIVNDGSTDASQQIVRNYTSCHPKVKLYSIKNHGVSYARNYGMKQSSGNWIALCDSDDIWFHKKIELQTKEIYKNNNIDLIGTSFKENKNKLSCNAYQVSIIDMCMRMMMQTSTLLFKKEIYKSIGGFDCNQKYAEDGNYLFRIAKHYNIYFLPICTIKFGMGKRGYGGEGLSGNLKEMHKGNIKNIKELKKENDISILVYVFLHIFYYCKYIRRKIIVKISNRE